jgi:UDP-2,3-diacylglucosamine pyrophosphatase LpxH
VRTLVISDLHLGSRARHDVLRWPAAQIRLLDALEGVDRLVLLGDVVELMTRNRQRSLGIAEPVLRRIGRRLGPDREIVLVPGNHDGALVRAWAQARGAELEPATPVDVTASHVLERLVAWLAPARARVSYPGVWLARGVWATHGHYLDRHLRPQSTIGIRYQPVRAVGRGEGRPADYERPRPRRRRRRAGRRREALPARLMSRPVGTLVEGTADLLRTAAMPRIPRLLMQTGLAPVTAAVLNAQMRHSALPAMAQVVRRLDVPAEWVLFGHVHRRGPVNGGAWRVGEGPRFVNTGAWVYEPLLVDRARPPHPYWPGGAVLLQDGREPQSLGLLDDLSVDDLLGLGERHHGARR